MRYLIIVVLLLVGSISAAQHKRKPPPPPGPPNAEDILRAAIAEECLFTNKYSKAKRRNFYPFKKAKRVILISFDNREGYIPVKKKVLQQKRVLEQVVLNSLQTDSLTSLLYNVGYTPIEQQLISSSWANCYEPRNGILFVDAAGKVFEYIEICFACERREKSSKRFWDGEYCDTKVNLMRALFADAGIKTGTRDKHPVLSYREILDLDTAEVPSALENKFASMTNKGENMSTLNKSELTLYYAINAWQIYRGYSGLSGLASFYANSSGDTYLETLTALRLIGASRLASTLETSFKYWPNKTLSKEKLKRREILLKIINKVDPKWQNLTDSLYNWHINKGGAELTPKEDFNLPFIEYIKKHIKDFKDEPDTLK